MCKYKIENRKDTELYSNFCHKLANGMPRLILYLEGELTSCVLIGYRWSSLISVVWSEKLLFSSFSLDTKREPLRDLKLMRLLRREGFQLVFFKNEEERGLFHQFQSMCQDSGIIYEFYIFEKNRYNLINTTYLIITMNWL